MKRGLIGILAIVAICFAAFHAAQAQRFHGRFGFYGPRFYVGPSYYSYYPYYAPPPVYVAPPAYYYPPPVAYPAPAAPPPPAASVPPAQYTVYFEFDHDQLTADAAAVVQRAAAAYRAGGNPPIHVIGFTDRAGTPSYNLSLSQRRAETVRQTLIRDGVPRNAITIAWRGENDPEVQTPVGAREPRNRRVLIVMGTGPIS
jgi:outer membrane protein OmpA-like peptidoglycan-associated protein